MLAGVFLLIFLAGPFVFRMLTKAEPSRWGLGFLTLSAVLPVAAGLGLRYGMAAQWGQDVQITLAAILLIWLGWIGLLAFGAQMMRRADPGLGMRRISGVIGALGTTVPWFGLASASLVGA
jgi:hypothetical protein